MTTTAGGGQALHIFSLMLLSCFILSVFSDLTVESLCIPGGARGDLNLKYGPSHRWWFWAM